MVYGLNVAPEAGYRVEVAPLNGDRSKVEIADQTRDGGLPLNRDYTFAAGRAVLTEHIPTRMEWRDPNRNPIPDFDNGYILNVSERAKALIERLEPGVHQLLPVDYFDLNGNLLGRRYFLVVCNRIDSIDRDRTTMILQRGMMWRPANDLLQFNREDIPPGFDLKVEPKLVFNNGQIGNAHIWHDKHLFAGTYISDELAHAIAEAGLSGVRPAAMETV